MKCILFEDKGVRYVNDFKRVLLENCKGVRDLDINLNSLDFKFACKPLLIGGKALEYYNIRESKNDVDFVVTREDYELLSYKYPDNLKNICDDLGVCKDEFELWTSICLFDYDFLSEDAVEEDEFLVISFEKLMFLKVLTIECEKSVKDLYLMRDRMAVINTVRQDFY